MKSPPAEDWVHRPEDLSPTVSAIVGDQIRRGLDVGVHVGDEMYQTHYWSHGEDRDLALVLYFASGRALWSTIREVLLWRFGSLERISRLLDFASGFGRVTRFMLTEIASDRVWVSDIQADAVETQVRQFGVSGVVSTTDPAQLELRGPFDAVVVSSLFTHLPRAAFSAWLRKLASLVSPGGVLMFSVHDLSLLEGGGGGEDFVFRAASESGKVAPDDYGSTWVSESFVENAIAEAFAASTWRKYPRGFASLQDLYVVVPEAGARIDLRPTRQVDGALDSCRVDGGNVLQLEGWVRDRLSRKQPRALRFSVAEVQAILPGERLVARRDVDRVLPGDATPAWGFRASLEIGRSWDPRVLLSIRVECGDGQDALLLELPLHDALLGNARLAWVWAQRTIATAEVERAMLENILRLQRDESRRREEAWVGREERWWGKREELAGRIAVLEGTIRWMETSRFWQLRNRWWTMKNWLMSKIGRA